MASYKVLSTKKVKPSLVEQAKESGIEIIVQEFISVKPILSVEKHEEIMRWVLSLETQHIVFTSANAVDALKYYLHQGADWFIPNWKIFCLSGETKNAVEAIHLGTIFGTAQNATMLANKIIDQGVKEIVFFCGNSRRVELPTILKDAGIKTHEVVLYETIETPLRVENNFDAILFFSPTGVQSFFSANKLKVNTVCFAIGKTTADAITEFSNNKIIVSNSPTQKMMLRKVELFFSNKG